MPLRARRPAQTLTPRMAVEETTQLHPTLQLYEDVIASDGTLSLPPAPRMIFVVHGSLTAADHTLRDEETVGSERAVALKAGGGGAMLRRWELTAGDAGSSGAAGRSVVSRDKLSARLGQCFCAVRRPADPLYPRHDPATHLFGKKLARISRRGRQPKPKPKPTRSTSTCRCGSKRRDEAFMVTATALHPCVSSSLPSVA